MAATTDVDVANLALRRCGQAQVLTTLTDATRNGYLANAFYADTRDEVMRLFEWPCLLTRSAVTMAVDTTTDFGYKGTIPSTCLRVVDINGNKEIPYRIEGWFIFCNMATGVSLRHIAASATPATWDRLLLAAVVARLASKMAMPLTQSVQLTSLLQQEFITILGMALQVHAQETKEDVSLMLAFLEKNLELLMTGRNIAEEA